MYPLGNRTGVLLKGPLRGKPARNDWNQPKVRKNDLGWEEDGAPPKGLPMRLEKSGDELVAHPSHRVEVPGNPGVRFEVFPEGHNEIVYCPGGREYVIAPNFPQDLLPRDYLTCLFNQQAQ